MPEGSLTHATAYAVFRKALARSECNAVRKRHDTRRTAGGQEIQMVRCRVSDIVAVAAFSSSLSSGPASGRQSRFRKIFQQSACNIPRANCITSPVSATLSPSHRAPILIPYPDSWLKICFAAFVLAPNISSGRDHRILKRDLRESLLVAREAKCRS